MPYRAELTEIAPLNDTVIRIRTTRPEGFSFRPGQYCDLAIDRPGFQDETRPFSFTGTPDESSLEFVVRVHRSHRGVTAELRNLEPGSGLLLDEPEGTISYRGPGCFIAGGTGITPFLSIFRTHGGEADFATSSLLFCNKTESDHFLVDELAALFGSRVRFLVTHEPSQRFESGFIDIDLLRGCADPASLFSVCGPDEMVKEVTTGLAALGVPDQNIIIEQ